MFYLIKIKGHVKDEVLAIAGECKIFPCLEPIFLAEKHKTEHNT